METSHLGIMSIATITVLLVPCLTLVESIQVSNTPYLNHVHDSKVKVTKPKWEPGIGPGKGNPFNSRSYNEHRHRYHRRPPRHPPQPEETSGRTFSIPSGTVFKLTPEITIPLMTSEDDRLKCQTEFGASFPIKVTFKNMDMSWKKMAQEFFVLDPIRRRNGFWNPPKFAGFEANDHDNLIHQTVPDHQHHRQSRDLSFLQLINETSSAGAGPETGFTPAKVVGGRCPVKSLTDRKSILKEVEIAGFRLLGMDSNPKACLLRAICEMHEFPIYHELGLLGEAVTVIFSFEDISRECVDDEEHFPLMKYLRPYINAEVAGKSGKCLAYHKKCPKSIFTYV